MTIPADFRGAAQRLTEADVERVAGQLGIEPRKVWAVSSVEAAAHGFLADGRPELLYEAERFHIKSGGQFDAAHPNLSSPTWNPMLYGAAGPHQYDRLAEAMELDRDAALQACSWGMFQVLGENYRMVGFDTIDDFVAAMCESEGRHLDAFAAYCTAKKLLDYLRTGDWARFALGYNGAGAARNAYAAKLAAAVATGHFPPADLPPAPGPAPSPSPATPEAGKDTGDITIPLGRQAVFPVSGEDIEGLPQPIPPDGLRSSDVSVCTAAVADGMATVASVAVGHCSVSGPGIDLAVCVTPPLVRIHADLGRIVISKIGAALARMPLAAGSFALVLMMLTRPADMPFRQVDVDPETITVQTSLDMTPVAATKDDPPPHAGGAELPMIGIPGFCFQPGQSALAIERCLKWTAGLRR